MNMVFRFSVVQLAFLALLSGNVSAESHVDQSNAQNPISIFKRDAEVQIDSGLRLGNQRINIRKSHQSGATQVYYPPALLPEWSSFEQEVAETCNSENDLDRIYSIPMRIHVDDRFYISNVDAAVSLLEGQGINPNAIVRSIPHSRFVVVLSAASLEQDQVLHDSARVGRIGDLERPRVKSTYLPEINVSLTGSCTELAGVVSEMRDGEPELLQGYVYAQEVSYDITEVKASVSGALRRDAINSIFSEETFEQVATASANSTADAPENGDEPLSIVMNLIGGGASETQSSSNATLSQERVVNRNFLNRLSSDYETTISGGCTGNECGEIETKILEFVLAESRALDVTFQKEADGSATLISGQIGYVTLSPTQYSALLETAPSFESDTDQTTTVSEGGKEGTSNTQTDKEKIIVKDDISWKLEGSVPVPTSANLLLITDLGLQRALTLDWSRAEPIETSDVIINAVYPAAGYRRGDVISYEEFAANLIFASNCRSRALEVPIQHANARALTGRAEVSTTDPRTIEDWDSSTNCGNSVGGTWTASSGHFFLVEGRAPVTVVRSKGPTDLNVDITVVEHAENVRKNGNWRSLQALSSVTYSGRTSRGRGSNKSCGAEVRFELQQYPNSCAAFLIDGFRIRE